MYDEEEDNAGDRACIQVFANGPAAIVSVRWSVRWSVSVCRICLLLLPHTLDEALSY